MKDVKQKESPVPILRTQMLDDQYMQRREKSKERMKVNPSVVERPQFIRTAGTQSSIGDESRPSMNVATTIQSVNSNEKASKMSSMQTTTRVEVKRTCRSSNFKEVQDDETN